MDNKNSTGQKPNIPPRIVEIVGRIKGKKSYIPVGVLKLMQIDSNLDAFLIYIVCIFKTT